MDTIPSSTAPSLRPSDPASNRVWVTDFTDVRTSWPGRSTSRSSSTCSLSGS